MKGNKSLTGTPGTKNVSVNIHKKSPHFPMYLSQVEKPFVVWAFIKTKKRDSKKKKGHSNSLLIDITERDWGKSGKGREEHRMYLRR